MMYVRRLETFRYGSLLLLLCVTASTDAFLQAHPHHGSSRGQQKKDRNKFVTLSTIHSATRVAGDDATVPQSVEIGDSNQQLDTHALLACRPPAMLHELDLGETLNLQSTPIEITRVASNPDIFVFRNFLPDRIDRDALKAEARTVGLKDAETKAGNVLHRTKSNVAWVYPDFNAEEFSSAGTEVASFMTGLCTQLFLNDNLLGSDDFEPQAVQVAQYTKGGKFDLHHDAYDRAVTVLTYLNGIAGTWFPFAQMTPRSSEIVVDDKEPPGMTLGGVGMTDGKVPGQDGVWVVGDEYEVEDDEQNSHVIRVKAGDAVVFYNYEYNEEISSPIMAWRSLHAGMPASQEKWIATNWFSSELLAKPSLPPTA